MKLLFLTGNLPYPPTDGWKIRVFSLVRGLARRHEVTVVSFMDTNRQSWRGSADVCTGYLGWPFRTDIRVRTVVSASTIG